jgi:hypothetical protein
MRSCFTRILATGALATALACGMAPSSQAMPLPVTSVQEIADAAPAEPVYWRGYGWGGYGWGWRRPYYAYRPAYYGYYRPYRRVYYRPVYYRPFVYRRAYWRPAYYRPFYRRVYWRPAYYRPVFYRRAYWW